MRLVKLPVGDAVQLERNGVPLARDAPQLGNVTGG